MVKLTNTGPYQPSPADVAEAGWGPSSTQPIHNNIAMSRTTASTQLAKCSDRALPGCLPKLPGSSKQWKGPIMISTTHLFTWLTYCTIVDQPKSNICLFSCMLAILDLDHDIVVDSMLIFSAPSVRTSFICKYEKYTYPLCKTMQFT